MNNLRNRVNLIGNIGMDPKVREIKGGRKMARFTLATTDNYRNSEGEKVSDTQWHNIVVWGNQASFAEKYLHKGQEIAVEGKITHREYTDDKGEKKYFTEVVANQILVLNYRDKQPVITEAGEPVE
ncbi:MAG TPA: single-stranded DNA-binding protein [Bacteroidetes bacterium]|nr:single-stranded DNA-binding protein [Bacteroidota bacterium]